MNIEQAIAAIEAAYPGAPRGKTAQRDHAYYRAARDLEFHQCQCAWDDPAYHVLEFVAESPKGTIHSVGYSERRRLISCGPKGYHPTRVPQICRP